MDLDTQNEHSSNSTNKRNDANQAQEAARDDTYYFSCVVFLVCHVFVWRMHPSVIL